MTALASLVYLIFFCTALIFAQEESEIKLPKRFFKPTVICNSMFMPESKTELGNEGLKSYSYNQHSINTYFPVLTVSHSRGEEIMRSTFQLLATSTTSSSNLYFEGLNINKQLNFIRLSLGLRGIYTSGNSVLFSSFVSFIAHEYNQLKNSNIQWAGTLLYSYTWDYNFSTRIGITKTFLFGVPNPFLDDNRIPLPVLGVRIGPLDRIYFDMIFPRYYSLNFPMGNKVFGSIFLRNYGSLFTIVNRDSSIAANGKSVILGRYDQLNGFSMHYRPNIKISLFLQTGFATNRYLFFDELKTFLIDNQSLAVFTLKNSLFISFGFGIRLGKSKSIYNNLTYYDAFNLNQQFDPADINESYPTGDIPSRPKEDYFKKLKRLQFKDIQDVIDNEL
jgi:hypothetical protein